MRVAIAAVAACALLAAAPRGDVVSVDGGRVAGTATRGVRVFLGIPYAAPPVGDLRWKPPQPVVPWHGVRAGDAWGAECPQTPYEDGSIYVRPQRPQSEDCLFVNVWTAARREERRPVLVWVHGGGLTRGSGYSDVRDGSPLARKGLVVVSLNYRLGPLGYLAHPELTAESPHHASGNYGVLDQIAALQWVRRNVAAFGGDPANVTVAGESAGSWSVNTLVASPLAAGLFRRAIGESGGRFMHTPLLAVDRDDLPSAERVGVAFARAAGASSLAALRAMPADKLIAIEPFRTMENVDGWVLPDEIRAIFERKAQNPGPVIVGSNADEMTPFMRGRTPTPEQLAQARDTVFTVHMRVWARLTRAAGSNAWLYYFTHVPPSPRRAELGAFHAAELPYVFNTIGFAGDPRTAGFEYTDIDRVLADTMSSYWADFATRGDPNGPGLPAWHPYDPTTEPYLDLGDTIREGSHLLKERLDLIEERRDRPTPSPAGPPPTTARAPRPPRPAPASARTAVPPATAR